GGQVGKGGDPGTQDRGARPRALRPASGRHPPRPRPAPADLREDGRVRPLRPRGRRLHVGADRPRRRAAGRRRSRGGYEGLTNSPAAAFSEIARSPTFSIATVNWSAAGSAVRTRMLVPGTSPWS